MEMSEAVAGMEMSALVNYIQPVHFLSFEHAESMAVFVHGLFDIFC